MLVVAVAFNVWLALHARSVQRQQASADAVRRFGGWVYYDYQIVDRVPDMNARSAVPSWLIQWLSPDFFHDVVQVNLVYSEDTGKREENDARTDEALAHLGGFPNLKHLLLHEGQASDDGLRNVAQLRNLEALYLWDAHNVTDAGIAHLKDHPTLSYIHCSESGIGDESLRTLSTIPRLEGMSLQGNHFTDRGLSYVKDMTQLQDAWFGTGENEITDAGLAHLRALANLETLGLQGTHITDEGLVHLAGLENLKKLHVSGSNVTDRQVLQLQRLPKNWSPK